MIKYYKINLREISQSVKQLNEEKEKIHKLTDLVLKTSENLKWEDDVARKYKRETKGLKEDLNNLESLIESYRFYLMQMSPSLERLVNQNKI